MGCVLVRRSTVEGACAPAITQACGGARKPERCAQRDFSSSFNGQHHQSRSRTHQNENCWKVVAIDGRVQTAFEEGMLDLQIPKRFKLRLKPGWAPTNLGRGTELEAGKDGLAIEGSTLAGGDLIAAFGLQGAEDRVKWELRYKDRSPAKLKSIRFHRSAAWM